MSLPKAVQDQIDRAEQLHREVYGDGKPPSGETVPPAEGDPSATPPAAPGQDTAIPAAPAEPEKALVTPPTPPDGAGDTVSRADYEALKAQFDKLQAAHSTLKGKEFAEVPRVNAENRALREEIAALKEQVGRLAAGIQPPQPAAGKDAGGDPPGNAFSKWFEDTYGPEHRGEFDAYIQSKINASTGEMRQAVERVSTTAAKTEKEKYWAALDEKVPGWEAIYNDPRFAPLLQEEEGNTGMTKAEFARKWEESHNADRVIPYILEFQERYGAPAPAAAKPPKAPAPSGAPKNKEAFVAPRSTAGGAAGTAPDPNKDIPYVPASEIMRLAVEVNTTRKWVGREKDLAALRAKHDAATRAGRVLQGQ